ncbi:hypothetical protein [Thiothrix subterranea]|uniref:hypothetical protein n=1 Tax=Thiothrix subterranea TaxID=2735563 RepID=UPI00280AED52|nr:hypothetical protein [Thiothrix subterranea]
MSARKSAKAQSCSTTYTASRNCPKAFRMSNNRRITAYSKPIRLIGSIGAMVHPPLNRIPLPRKKTCGQCNATRAGACAFKPPCHNRKKLPSSGYVPVTLPHSRCKISIFYTASMSTRITKHGGRACC